MKVYVYNNFHNGDIITNRALVKELLKHDLEIALGSYQDRHYLVEDLPVRHVICPHDENHDGGLPKPASPCLSGWCPAGFIPVNTHCGCFPDIDVAHRHNWAGIVLTWNRHAQQRGIPVTLSSKHVPMIDFAATTDIRLKPNAVLVENGKTRSLLPGGVGPYSRYEFNMAEIGSKFPGLNFYCTAAPGCDLPNVADCSGLNLVQVSLISNQCEAMIGKGSGAFLATYTEVNRFKPRAVVGFLAHRFWEYDGNRLQYLNTTEELFGFLSDLKKITFL